MVLAVSYSFGLSGCLLMAWLLRFDFEIPDHLQTAAWSSIFWVVPLKLITLFGFRQFSGMLSFFGVRDLLRLFGAIAVSALVMLLLRFLGDEWLMYGLSRGVILVDFVLSFLGLSGLRLGFRIYREWTSQRTAGGGTHRRRNVGIMGAGHCGASLATDLFARRGLGMRPIVFFDDDSEKWGTRVHDVPVVGRPELLCGSVLGEQQDELEDLDEVVIALPRSSAKRIREVVHIAQEAGLKCEIVPSIEELATGRVKVSQLRNVQITDLLGRDPIELEAGNIRELIRDKVVMVTGAGGSIGSELCRQVVAFNPNRLLLVEQCEVQLFKVEQELVSRGYGSCLAPLIADILDRDRMRSIFQRFSPDLVLHAAAHKHVPMMECQPVEAFKNNTLGTLCVAELAQEAGVGLFLLISTDKAINPTNVMGASKRFAEMFIQSLFASRPTGTRFVAVRFGNVLGSSGSVVPIFEKQITDGGPVKVTHPDVTRYFMTIPEAVGLVLQSATQARGGEIFVLDMGSPVKIVDLANQLIELHGQRPGVDIEIQFTGLRPGEKLFEEIAHDAENLDKTDHPKILRFICEPAPIDWLRSGLTDINRKMYDLEPDQLKLLFQKTIPEYKPYLT